jgi:HK97 family phage major capsid protein
MSLSTQLREKRANTWEQMKSLLDAADAESRGLDAAENTQFDRMNVELEKYDERIKNIEDAERRASEINESVEKVESRPREVAPTSPDKAAMQEVRDWILNKNPNHFLEVDGSQRGLAQGVVEVRTLSKLSNGAGGYAVASGFYPQLVQNLIVNSAILRAGARVLNTSDGTPLPIAVTTTHATGALVAEAGTIATSEPVFSQYSLGAYKYGALGQASYELVNDAAFDIESFLAEDMGRGVGNALGADLITGNGTNKPRGLLTDTTLGVTGGAGVVGVPTADNLIDLFFSVTAPYRNQPTAAWLMNDATVATVRKFKDTTNQYIWQPGLQAGVPDTLLGKAVYTDPNMPTTALSAKSVAFGDLSKYWVRIAGGVRFERSTEFAFNTDLITYRSLIRADGALVDRTGAVKHFIGNAA